MSAKKKKSKRTQQKLEVTQLDGCSWQLQQQGSMRVAAKIYADPVIMRHMDSLVFSQLANVASLPGIVDAAFAMPDAHSGYGFPIGGVAAFSSQRDGVVSAGGVGFDIACGVRTLLTELTAHEIRCHQKSLADILFKHIPAGLGIQGKLELNSREMDAMLLHGASWAVASGFGEEQDLRCCEERGTMAGAMPDMVSDDARKRQKGQMGTLGSGNHYLEVQEVLEIFDRETADIFGLHKGQAVVSIHCGSRGLGHQIGSDYLAMMSKEAPRHGLNLPDRELACAPLNSRLGRNYLGAMRAGINCALANRQIISHLAREAFALVFPGSRLRLLYDVSHNTCKEELHTLGGTQMRLFVHRKGATRAFGPGHPDLPPDYANAGQPVIVGGSMGTLSWVLAGCGSDQAFSSANHGAGRSLSRSQAKKQFQGREVISGLEQRGILLRAASFRSIAEEAPGAYKDSDAVVNVVQQACLARKVASLTPLICIKG